MFLKVVLVIVAAFFIYVFFFKKSREKDIERKDDLIEDEMIACPSCGTYVSKKEAILSDRKFYCSKECLLNKGK